MRADDVLESSLASRSTEAVQALEVIQREVGLPETQVTYVFTAEELTVDDEAYREQIDSALAEVRAMLEFAAVETFYSSGRGSMVSPDRRATYAVAFFHIPLNDAIDRLPEIRERTGMPSDLTVWVTGAPPIFEELEAAGRRDLTRAEAITLPLVAVALVLIFGLSMGYEVFLLSRIKEEYDTTGDNEASVALGMRRSGRIITSAALIIVLLGSAFATVDVIIVKALGFGLAIAVFLDATVVRALMVPAIMRLFGRWNWWAPAFILRRLPIVE